MAGVQMNKAQKRAISLNQDLNNLHTDHLHSFIDGLEPAEPPTYRFFQGVIQPPLVKVTLKEGARSYDFGNVIYSQSQEVNIKHVTVCRSTVHVGWSALAPGSL